MPVSPRSALRRLGRSLVAHRPTPGRARQAGRYVTVVAVGLVGTALLLGPERGAMGLMGAMAANAGRDDPMPKRIWTLVVVGLTTLACQAIGLSIAPYPWLSRRS